MTPRWLLVLAALSLPGLAPAADLRVFPPKIDLVGPHAEQRLVVVDAEAGVATSDRTADAAISSSNAKVAVVRDGVVRAVDDGETSIVIQRESQTVRVPVVVRGTKTTSPPDFVIDIQPVLTRSGCNSGSCHGALAGKCGLKLSLRGYDPAADQYAIARQALGRRVNVADPPQSLLLEKPTRSLPHGGGKRFETDSEEYRRIAAWVAAGAPPADAKAASVVAIEMLPPAARLKTKDTLQVIVQARYSDGRIEDVTRWAKFTSAGETVATVDEAGRITVAGSGEAAINALFASRVAAAVVSVPYDRPADPKLYEASPKHSFIDVRVLAKLEALRIPPSGPCDDRTFVRRLFLDCIGALPTPAEVDSFAKSMVPDKRLKLLDELLARPEYVDYWTYKWSDLLLVSSRKLPTPAVWAYYRAVRSAVSENTPWDRFARELLTARGSTLEHGAANYFTLHKDPAELIESTSVTFLGTSITCARCHNHPLEKWTQDQYWAFANLFGRVALKAGERSGEVIVTDAPTGDIMHLRRGTPTPPAPLDAMPLAPDSPVDRRTYFVDWLTKPENPYFAKAHVNRVWKNFMGRGLVEAEDDIRQTNPATHPELLDELAADFAKGGYDVKKLIRSIVGSAAYQRSADPAPGNEGDDRYYSRYLLRRLSAEVILDAYSQMTGVPSDFNQAYGANRDISATALYPPGTRAQGLPDIQIVSRFLDAFGRPPREATCACERQQEATVSQALHLNNGKSLNDKLRAKGSLVERWVGEKIDDAEAIRRVFRLGLAREPSSVEAERFAKLLAQYGDDRNAAFEDLCWAVFTSRDFLFNH